MIHYNLKVLVPGSWIRLFTIIHRSVPRTGYRKELVQTRQERVSSLREIQFVREFLNVVNMVWSWNTRLWKTVIICLNENRGRKHDV